MSSLIFKVNSKVLVSTPLKTSLLLHKRTGFFDFLGRGKSDKDEKKDILNSPTTKQETKELAESLVKGEEEAAAEKNSEIKVLDMKSTKVIGETAAYESYLKSLKEHRIASLKVNDWYTKDVLKAKEFEKFETILKDLLLKYKLELNELAVPFKDFKTKFLFAKDIQAQTGVLLSDYNITLFTSPKDYKTFFYEVVLSGDLFKYQEKKPLAIDIEIVSGSEAQTDKEIALKRLQAEFSGDSEDFSIKHKDFSPEYDQLLDSIVERTKILRPETSNVRVKTYRNFKDQEILKRKLEQEIDYSHSKMKSAQSLEKN